MLLQRHNMPPEQAAYEIPEIWEEEWFGPTDRQRMKLFAERVPEGVKSLLDAGCGNGLFLRHVQSTRDVICLRLCGIDRCQTALRHVHTEKYLSTIDCMPFQDNEFDIVTSLEVLEHLPSTTYDHSLKEICRVARKFILIGVPFNQDIRNSLIECPYCSCRFNVDYHLRSFSETTVRNLFTEHGFYCKDIFFIQPENILKPFFYNLDMFKKVMSALYKRPDEAKYPGYAVCPACLYENRRNIGSHQKQVKRERNVLRQILYGIVGRIVYRHSYHWIGALYEETMGHH